MDIYDIIWEIAGKRLTTTDLYKNTFIIPIFRKKSTCEVFTLFFGEHIDFWGTTISLISLGRLNAIISPSDSLINSFFNEVLIFFPSSSTNYI